MSSAGPPPVSRSSFLLVCRGDHLGVALRHLRRAGVVPDALVQGGDLRYFLRRQKEVEESEVVPDMRRVLGPGNHDGLGLEVPAKDDLRAALAVLFRQFCKDRLIKQSLVPMPQGVPRLNCHALRSQELLQALLLEVGVDLCLEEHGTNLADGENFPNLLLCSGSISTVLSWCFLPSPRKGGVFSLSGIPRRSGKRKYRLVNGHEPAG